MSDPREDQWERGWDGHERAQLLRMSRFSLIQKIQWLEDAHRTVLALEQSRREQHQQRLRSTHAARPTQD